MREIKTYPNQKVVTVRKAPCDKENIYGVVNVDCMYKAMSELTHNELKIYLYCAMNQDNYKFALSPVDIAEKTGASKRKIQDSINGLINKGYMTCTSGNQYVFSESNISMYEKDTVYGKDTILCTERTQYCVQKVHDTVYEKDIEIVQDNTVNNTKIVQLEGLRPTDQPNTTSKTDIKQIKDIKQIDDSIKRKVCALAREGKKYNKNNPEIQNILKDEAPYLDGRLIYLIIEENKMYALYDDDDEYGYHDLFGDTETIAKGVEKYSLDYVFTGSDGYKSTIRNIFKKYEGANIDDFNDKNDSFFYKWLTEDEYGWKYDKNEMTEWFAYVKDHNDIYSFDELV